MELLNRQFQRAWAAQTQDLLWSNQSQDEEPCASVLVCALEHRKRLITQRGMFSVFLLVYLLILAKFSILLLQLFWYVKSESCEIREKCKYENEDLLSALSLIDRGVFREHDS